MANSTSRRRFVAAAGALGVSAIAGCLDGGSNTGDGGGSGTTDVVFSTVPEETGAYAMTQGMAAVVNENSDSVFMDARPSEGSAANVGRVNRGDADVAYSQSFSVNKLLNGDEPYDQIDVTFNQLFHVYSVENLFVTANDWEMVNEAGGSRISPTPRGSGLAPALERALDYALDDYERISVTQGEQASAMSEGSLDVAHGTVLNEEIEPSWLQEMKNVIDASLLFWTDEEAQQIADDPYLNIKEVEMSDGWAHGSGEIRRCVTEPYGFIVNSEVEDEVINEIVSILMENREELGEYASLLSYYSDEEFFIPQFNRDMPFHPGAADVYEAEGIWEDDMVRG